MTFSSLAKKLRLHTAQRALILNAPDGYLEKLGEVSEEVKIEQEPNGEFDFAHLFVKDRNELDQFIDQVLLDASSIRERERIRAATSFYETIRSHPNDDEQQE